MSIELAVVAAAFLAWCLLTVVWKSLVPNTSDADFRLIWREDALRPWHEVPAAVITDSLRSRMCRYIDDTTYADLLDIVLVQRPLGATTVQFAVVLTSGESPTDVLFVSDVHTISARLQSAVAAAPLLIGRHKNRTASAVS